MLSKNLLEADIKIKLLEYLFAKGKLLSSTIINEFTIEGYARRADLVVINNHSIVAYEVKSASDSLLRLDGQVNTYLKYFDKVIVLADTKHTQKAIDITPDNVGIWEVNKQKITQLRRGKSLKINNKQALLSLLTKSELCKFKLKNEFDSNEFSRNALIEAIVRECSENDIRQFAIDILSTKYSKTSDALKAKFDAAGFLCPEDIELLSPYVAERRRIKKKIDESAKLWDKWSSEQAKTSVDISKSS